MKAFYRRCSYCQGDTKLECTTWEMASSLALFFLQANGKESRRLMQVWLSVPVFQNASLRSMTELLGCSIEIGHFTFLGAVTILLKQRRTVDWWSERLKISAKIGLLIDTWSQNSSRDSMRVICFEKTAQTSAIDMYAMEPNAQMFCKCKDWQLFIWSYVEFWNGESGHSALHL